MNIEDLDFDEVCNVLDDLKKINYYNVIFYFNRKYNLNIKAEKHINYYDPLFAKGNIGNYNLQFCKSGSGKSIYIEFFSGAFSWKNNVGETARCRSIHRLENAFLKKCKELSIQIKKKR